MFSNPLVQPVNTVRMAKIMDPWRIAFGYGCFWKLIPEFMEPFIQSRFTVIVSRLIRKECCPVRVCISDDTVIST
jgi:hypothetical protein